MMRAAVHDLIYRTWAPWDRTGIRQNLIDLLASGEVDPRRYPRSLDLGCGTGADVVHLAEQGFDSYGVDISAVAPDRARSRAERAGVSATFVEGDLTATAIPGLEGHFDFLLDFRTLDDLRGTAREEMAALVTSLARPGARFLEWCFYGETEELPLISFKGTSKMTHVAPGELERLFGRAWDMVPFSSNEEWRTGLLPPHQALRPGRGTNRT